MAMIADPQGAPFYVMTPTPPPGQPDAKSDVFDAKKPGHCRWMQLDTGDAEEANVFYKELFDWRTENVMPMGPAGDYRFIAFEGTQIGAFNPMLPAGESPHWLLFLGVNDIHAAREAMLAHGGTISQDIHQVPGDDLIIVGRDPAGAKIGFVAPKG
jgi:predicted enzyme related to lactoylglutathione lyase